MALRLADFEASPRADGDYEEALADLQKRLRRLQITHIVHGRRAIILFEGWDAGGKGGTIQRMTAGWDARHVHVWPIAAPGGRDATRHYLARFWERLPAAGEIAVFDRSWYGRVLVERVDGLATKAEWTRAYDEINEFEAQQTDAGTVVVKLFLHIDEAEQARRFRRRLSHPWKRWKLGLDDLSNRAGRADYVTATEDMLARTDTRWAPWTVIDAGRKKYARLAALAHVADRLEKAVPTAAPDPDPAIMEAARAAGLMEPAAADDQRM